VIPVLWVVGLVAGTSAYLVGWALPSRSLRIAGASLIIALIAAMVALVAWVGTGD
jgi:hypothetical protein